MRFLHKYWIRYRKQFFMAVGFLTIEAGCDLLGPTIVSHVIDNGVRAGSLATVLRLSGLMLLVTGIGAFGAIMRNRMASRVSQRFGADLRYDLFAKVNTFSFEEASKHEAASLITRITNDAAQIQNFANGLMRIFVKAPMLCIGSIVMVVFLSWRLALILLILIPIVALLMFLSMKIAFPFFAEMQKRLDKNNSVIREYLSGVRVVKAFNRFDWEVARFDTSNDALAAVSIRANRVQVVFVPLISFAVNMAVVYLLWTAQPAILNGHLRVGLIVAFINYITQIMWSLTMIFNVYQMFIRALASAERVGEVLSVVETPSLGTLQADGVTGAVAFDHVSFSYPNTVGEAVLKDIDFKIASKETLGVIGSTGSGKSTLVHLLLDFFRPTAGQVLLDEVPVQDYDVKQLREAVSLVSQTAQLFSGTIADNIRWGKMDATMDEVIAAAKVAQAHDFITSFRDGYDTVLGQGGVNLSGGQKQRISIARAVIRHPRILIFDDSVSAVDVATESAILQSIQELSHDMTCILISQRISSVMNLPKILVLDDGEMAGFGSHTELMRDCRVYQEIVQSQMGKVVGI